MLYLVQPDYRMKWSNMLPDATIFKAMREHGLDLAKLDWAEAERNADETTVRLALRHGHVTDLGIALEAWIVLLQDRPGELRANHQAVKQSRAKLEKQTEFVNSLMGPEYAEHGRELDIAVDESVERTAAEADEELEQKLSGDARTELVEHWVSLGGRVPRPA